MAALDGLMHALRIVEKECEAEHHHQQPAVVAGQVRVREAGAVVQLFLLDIPGVGHARHLGNALPLHLMDQASHVLLLVKDPLIPKLRFEPTSKASLMILGGCARRLRETGDAAGGSFRQRARDVARDIDAYVVQACGHPRFSSYAPLLASIDDLLHGVDLLLDARCTIRDQAAAQGAEAAEVEQADEAAAA